MRVRLWRHDITLASPITSASQVHGTRTHLFLELEIDGVRGLGEISPQPDALNGDPGVEDVISELELFTVRQFVEAAQREGAAPTWARVTHFAGSRPASYAATALLEMALLDADLRSRHRTIEEQWPQRFVTPVQATVSLLDDNPWSPPGDAAQIRAKVSSAPVPAAKWAQLADTNLPVLLDFNCSGGTVEEVVRTLDEALAHVRVAGVEQPFAPGNVVEHARLAARIEVAVSLDEGVRHRRDLDQIVRYRAARVVCVKPARVGGYSQARTMIERAQSLGLEVYLGGFFESPLARRANRALAHHYLERPSDIAASNMDTEGVVSPDSWGCGFLAGTALRDGKPLVNRQW